MYTLSTGSTPAAAAVCTTPPIAASALEKNVAVLASFAVAGSPPT